MILHLVAQVEWDSKQANQAYVPDAFAHDGFIHCTQGDALLLKVANNFYKSTPGEFLVLGIDETKVTAPVKWEAASAPAAATLPTTAVAGSVAGAAASAGATSTPVEAPPEVKAEYGETAPSPQPSPPRGEGEPADNSPDSLSSPKGEGDSGAESAVLFPHIYGPLNRDSIMGIRRMLRAANGKFVGFAPLDDAPKGMNLKTPSQLANELVDATGDFSDALARYKDRIEGRIDELNKNIKDNLDQ
jgi:uncharacterized protein (DUF952 family)